MTLNVHSNYFVFFVVASRGFRLTHDSALIAREAWVAVEPNGAGLPSTSSSPRLGALLSSPKQAPRKTSKD